MENQNQTLSVIFEFLRRLVNQNDLNLKELEKRSEGDQVVDEKGNQYYDNARFYSSLLYGSEVYQSLSVDKCYYNPEELKIVALAMKGFTLVKVGDLKTGRKVRKLDQNLLKLLEDCVF